MEVEKTVTEDVAAEVTTVTEKEKALAIEKKKIEDRNKRAEEQNRVQEFIKELDVLQKKWNVSLLGKVEFVGIGSNLQPRMDVVVNANPSAESKLLAEPAGEPVAITPTQE